jgi:PAS domain S-box-containing protein
LHDTLDLIRDAVICADVHGNILQMNRVAEALTGWSESEAKGRPTPQTFKTIDEESGEDLEDPVARVLRGGSGAELTEHVLLVAKDGTARPISISNSGAPLLDANNHLIGVALVFHDHVQEEAEHQLVSEQREGRRALAKSEKKYRLLFATAKDGILILDGETGIITDVNPFLLELTGYAQGDFLGKQLWDIGFLGNISASREAFQELKAKKYVRYDDLPLEGRDGKKIDVEFVSNVYAVEDRKIIQCNIRDISARKRVEADRARLIAAIEQAAEMFVVIDAAGNINYVNPAFESITGFTRAEVVGANASLLTSGAHDEAYYQAIWSTVTSGKTWRGQMVTQKKDGSLFTEDVSISPVRNTAGIITGYVAVKHDVSRDLALELQLRQAQKMEAVGRLAGGVAHDFNNLLSVILTYSELGLRALAPGEPLSADLEEIKKAGERAATLTKQLLAFSRQQVLEPRVLDINELVVATGKMLERLIGEDIELTVRPGNGLGLIRVDPGQFDQVLMNLAVNSRDAMPDGGKVTIETSNAVLDDEYAETHLGALPGRYVMLSVTDTGIGMDKDTQGKIFDPFFTTKDEGRGTGLGLSTVFGIVQQSQGHICVVSEPGQGTTFKLYFPRVDEAAAAAKAPRADLCTLSGTGTVLLVEDEEQIRTMVRNLLRQLGYKVLSAKNGAEALLISARQPQGAIDLLLTDVVMPNMSGAVLAKRLVSARPDMKVLCMSGYTDEAVLKQGILEAGLAFIQKPITPDKLARKIREVLARPAPRLQNRTTA